MMASTLFLLLLGLVVRILIPMLSYFRWTSARAEILQAAALSARYLVGDLQRAPFVGVNLASNDVLSIHGVQDVTDTGRAVWSPRLLVYSHKNDSLTRVEAPGGAARLLKPPLADLNAFLLDPQHPHKTLVRGLLKQFQLTSRAGPGLLRLRMVFSLEVPNRPAQTYEHLQSITLRNGSGQ